MLIKPSALAGLLLLALPTMSWLRTSRLPAAENAVDVQGGVSVLPQSGSKPVSDASKVAVWLAPLDTSALNAPPAKYEMLQRDKKFEPPLLVVPIGSTVAFPNLDPWFHNVFSLYRGKRFDLGLYQAGDTKYVKFDRPGASYIFCNIHPDMSAVVLTVDSPYFAVSDKNGHISIAAVPAGRYQMRLWYENADPAALQTAARDVTVGEGKHTLPMVSLRSGPRDLHVHKNKYGHEYETGSLAPAY
jgi:plastocyanin